MSHHTQVWRLRESNMYMHQQYVWLNLSARQVKEPLLEKGSLEDVRSQLASSWGHGEQ